MYVLNQAGESHCLTRENYKYFQSYLTDYNIHIESNNQQTKSGYN